MKRRKRARTRKKQKQRQNTTKIIRRYQNEQIGYKRDFAQGHWAAAVCLFALFVF